MTTEEIERMEGIILAIESLEKQPVNKVYWTNPGHSYESRESGPFASLGEQMVAVRNVVTPGGVTDERLFQVRAAHRCK